MSNTSYILTSDHKEHLKAVGVPDPPDTIEVNDKEYQDTLEAWRKTHYALSRVNGVGLETIDELHKRALGTIAWKQYCAKNRS